MKQPSAVAYLFGNPFVFFALGITTLIVGIMAFTTQGMGVPALIMLGVMGYATTCNRQVATYSSWKREWDGMNGQPPKQPFRIKLSWLRYPVGIGLWLPAAGFIASTPDAAPAPLLVIFWIGSLLGGGALVVKAIKGAHRAVPQTNETVAVCVSVPLRSMPIVETYNNLPSYCQNLLT